MPHNNQRQWFWSPCYGLCKRSVKRGGLISLYSEFFCFIFYLYIHCFYTYCVSFVSKAQYLYITEIFLKPSITTSQIHPVAVSFVRPNRHQPSGCCSNWPFGHGLFIGYLFKNGLRQRAGFFLRFKLSFVWSLLGALMHAKWRVVPTSCKLAGRFPSKSLDNSHQALQAGLKRTAVTTVVGPEAIPPIQNSWLSYYS